MATDASGSDAGSGVLATPLLRADGLVKDFPGLRALDDVSLEVGSGEIVALVGHNGSGKSTLVKILAGVYTADSGTAELTESGGQRAELHIIHQDLGLIAELDAIENLGLSGGDGVSGLAPTRQRGERDHALELVSRFGAPFAVDVPVSRLAPAQRAVIAIARALDGWTHDRNVLILDEPTEALHANEVEVLFDAVRRVVERGAGVVFISHRLDEVLHIADRVVVLRDGRKVADVESGSLDHDALVRHVTGVTARENTRGSHRSVEPVGVRESEILLDVRALSGGGVEHVDLRLHAGEVLGIAGVLGSGRDALPGMLFGAAPSAAEQFRVRGTDYPIRSPRASILRGLAFVAGDRARFGSVRAMNARENMTLPNLRAVTGKFGALRLSRERQLSSNLVKQYDVRPQRTEQSFAQFSGGNQQKIVFAKWLRNDPRVLLLEEPTQGVDIGAKRTIYEEIDRVAEAGMGVLVCSSDTKELVRLCDRVLVLRGGRVTAELAGDDLTEQALVLHGYGLASASDDPDHAGERAYHVDH